MRKFSIQAGQSWIKSVELSRAEVNTQIRIKVPHFQFETIRVRYSQQVRTYVGYRESSDRTGKFHALSPMI